MPNRNLANLTRGAAAIAITAHLSACQALTLAKYDAQDPGGLLGHFSNEYVYHAYTDQMELFRATEMYAILVEAGKEWISDPQKEVLFISETRKVNKALVDDYYMLNLPCRTSEDNMEMGCHELLEAQYGRLELMLLDMAKIALPTDELESLLKAAGKGNWLDALEIVITAAGQVILVFHEGAAVNRSAIYIAMQTTGNYTSFKKAEADFLKLNGNTDQAAPDFHAMNAMFYLAREACTDISDRLPATVNLDASLKPNCGFKVAAQSPPVATPASPSPPPPATSPPSPSTSPAGTISN